MVSEKLGFVLQIILFIVPLVFAKRRIGSLQKEVSSLVFIEILNLIAHHNMVQEKQQLYNLQNMLHVI